jgi:hypothetical protein
MCVSCPGGGGGAAAGFQDAKVAFGWAADGKPFGRCPAESPHTQGVSPYYVAHCCASSCASETDSLAATVESGQSEIGNATVADRHLGCFARRS